MSSQTPHDFNLDFIQLAPGTPGEPPEGTVVARVKVAQTFLMPLMQALAQHQTAIENLMQQAQQQKEGEEGDEPR